VRDDMNGGEEAGVGIETDTVTKVEIAIESGTETAIGSIEDMRNVIEMEMVITDITADSDQDHAKCTTAEGRLDEISILQSISWRPSKT
ncbi:MAG: hypothetical protein Q9180_007246, partial [Flavoplaca navasiana]